MGVAAFAIKRLSTLLPEAGISYTAMHRTSDDGVLINGLRLGDRGPKYTLRLYRNARDIRYGAEETPALLLLPKGAFHRVGDGYSGSGWVGRFVSDTKRSLEEVCGRGRQRRNAKPKEEPKAVTGRLPKVTAIPGRDMIGSLQDVLVEGEEARCPGEVDTYFYVREDIMVTNHGRVLRVDAEKNLVQQLSIYAYTKNAQYTNHATATVQRRCLKPSQGTRSASRLGGHERVDLMVAFLFVPPPNHLLSLSRNRLRACLRRIEPDVLNNRADNLVWLLEKGS